MAERPYIIGVTGGSGSGKTFFIKKLRSRFGVQHLCIVSQDDYYRPRTDQVTDAEGIQNFDLPESFEHEALIQDLETLINGQYVERLEYTFNNTQATPEKLVFHPAPVIIIEGLFVMHFEDIRKMCDLKIFIDAQDILKVKRRILRDQMERNYPIEDVLYRYEHHVQPAYENFIAPYKNAADLIVNNNEPFDAGLEVICAFIQSRIPELQNQD